MFEAWAWGTYIFFSVFLAVGIVWVWFALPETKNATLEEMDRVFKSHTGEEDARMLAEAQRDVGLISFLLERNSDEKKLATEVVQEHYEGRSWSFRLISIHDLTSIFIPDGQGSQPNQLWKFHCFSPAYFGANTRRVFGGLLAIEYGLDARVEGSVTYTISVGCRKSWCYSIRKVTLSRGYFGGRQLKITITTICSWWFRYW